MPERKRFFLWGGILVSFCLHVFIFNSIILRASGQGKEHLPYIVRSWTTEEGLPQHSVLCLLQDKTGYIWLGTWSGLARFDGVEFRIFNRWNTPKLNSDSFTAIFEDAEGALWLGTGKGLSRLKNGKWQTFTTADGLSDNNVTCLNGSGQGKNRTLWIGTANGLNRFKDGKFRIYSAKDDMWGNSITAMFPRTGGGLWVGTADNGLYVLEDETYKPLKAEGTPGHFEITALYEENNSGLNGSVCLWIGTETGLFCLRDSKITTPLSHDHPLANNAVRSLEKSGSRTLLVGTDGEGLYRFQNGGFQLIPLPPAIAGDFLYALLEDRESNLWIGTYTAGLVQLTQPRVKTVLATSRENRPGRNRSMVHALMEEKNRALLVGTDRDGLVRINFSAETPDIPGEMQVTAEKVQEINASRVTTLYRDRDNSLWVGMGNRGLTRLTNGTSQVFTTRNGLSSNRVTALCRDNGGTLWAGTTRGLNRFDKNTFHSLPGPVLHVRTIAPYLSSPQDKQNTKDAHYSLWVGTDLGLKRLTNNRNRLEDFSTPGGETFVFDILSFCIDQKGWLWVGTNGSGLARINVNTGEMNRYTTDHGLPGNYILSILEDNEGNLWMGSYRGVFRVSRKQLDDAAKGRISSLTPLCFDERDGMKSSECVAGGQPSALETIDGELGFPTLKGIAFFDPSAITMNPVPPPVVIQEIFADNEPVNMSKNKVFSQGKRVFEFYFTALSFTVPEKVKIRYKLEGFDTRWMEVAPRQKRAALYLNLGSGDYTFRVSACNNDGLWNHTGAFYSFSISPPLYKKPLFYLFLILFLAAAAVVFLFYYKKKSMTIKTPKKEDKYKTSALLPETVDLVLPRLNQMIGSEKVYLDADLTLKKLAKQLNVHYNHLSQIINERMGKSFNDFINSYRIEEAKVKLADPAEQRKTILEIAYETGFYSKSVFNTAFKKFTGMTPSEFRKKSENK